ncbi:MAG: hypothetical protein CALGDGBN_02413 [Pseudomonadales bacterium]|nr:hypothetical protein [Pseudomonadales bacterium]
MGSAITVAAAVEGLVDEAVAQRLIRHAGAEPGAIYPCGGKAQLRKRIPGFNNAARHAPWLVLVDLDRDEDCALPLRAAWIPAPAPRLCFRVVVRAVEAWLIADAVALAEFLGVSRGKVPVEPDSISDPKQALVNLARGSRRTRIRADMVPREGSGRDVGPAYTSRLIEFVSGPWRPAEAAAVSDSLSRAIVCLEKLIASP